MTSTAPSGGARVKLPPPLLVLAIGLAAVLLHRFAPLPLDLSGALRKTLGITSLATAAGLMAGAFRLFQKTGQDPAPWKPSPEIIVGGVYRFTRNPMYVAMALLLLGIGFLRANTWLLGAAPVFLVLVYLTAVRHEERYLEERFGESYRAYRQRTRRWL